MNRKLIRANLAIARGERAEAERLIREMKASGQASQPEQRALMLWLDAQAQQDRETRIRKLYDLINSVGADDPYARLAREYLQEEAAYAEAEEVEKAFTVFGMTAWKAALFAVLGVVAVVALIVLFTPRAEPETVAQVDNTAAPPATLPPDRSRPLVPEGFSVRYDKGILQVAAIEDDSVRVLSADGESTLNPVEGARFYALNIYFECREGICESPPEAGITLRLDDGTLIEPRPNAIIAGEPQLAPIALGRTTQGWLIFEIPVINGAESLLVYPTGEGRAIRTTPEPLIIRLEAP